MAEVLITLTIIGVIAAITIPNLMQSYKKHQIEVGIKEAYSILKNVISTAESEHGPFSELLSNKPSVQNISQNYIIPYVKVAKSCINNKNTCNVFKDNCFKSVNNKVLSGYQLYCPGDSWESAWSGIILNNGMSLGITTGVYDSYLFVMDINGLKEPNKIGYDIFYFQYKGTSSKQLCGGVGYDSCSSLNTSSCLLNGSAAGFDCINYIIKNGWKIPDDYPVKKF